MAVNGTDIAPSYAFYTDEYHGHMSEEDFESALPDALADVEWRIWPGADVSGASLLAKCRMAVCAVVELVGNPDRTRTSYHAGDVSETFGAAAPFSLRSEAVVRRYLGNAGILKEGRWL